MNYRHAKLSEINKLNAFIRSSKGYWSYSDSFLDYFMEKWGLTSSHFQHSEIVLIEENDILYGLFAFKMNAANNPELDLFFINPNFIRQGIGKIMWQTAEVLTHYGDVNDGMKIMRYRLPV